jgi:hypothetical protein
MGLLKVTLQWLDKTMGIYVPVIKDKTSVNSFVLAGIYDHSLQYNFLSILSKKIVYKSD